MPFPLISARLPSALRRTMTTSGTVPGTRRAQEDDARPGEPRPDDGWGYSR